MIKWSAARRQKKKSRRTAEVFSHAYSYTAAFERSKPPFLFIFSRNDAVSLLKAAAKGGSRHEAHTVSTKSDGHWHIKKSPSTAGGNSTHEYELSNQLNTAYNSSAPVCIFQTGAFCIFSKVFLRNFPKSTSNFNLVIVNNCVGITLKYY